VLSFDCAQDDVCGLKNSDNPRESVSEIIRKLHFEAFFMVKFRFGLAIFVGNYIFMDSAGAVFQLKLNRIGAF